MTPPPQYRDMSDHDLLIRVAQNVDMLRTDLVPRMKAVEDEQSNMQADIGVVKDRQARQTAWTMVWGSAAITGLIGAIVSLFHGKGV